METCAEFLYVFGESKWSQVVEAALGQCAFFIWGGGFGGGWSYPLTTCRLRRLQGNVLFSCFTLSYTSLRFDRETLFKCVWLWIHNNLVLQSALHMCFSVLLTWLFVTTVIMIRIIQNICDNLTISEGMNNY